MNYTMLNNGQENIRLKQENDKLKLLLEKMQIITHMDNKIEILTKENSEIRISLQQLYDKCNELKKRCEIKPECDCANLVKPVCDCNQVLAEREKKLSEKEAMNILTVERLNECESKYQSIRNHLVEYKKHLENSDIGLKEQEITTLNKRVGQLEVELHKHTSDNLFLSK
jgi:hypothetical protein